MAGIVGNALQQAGTPPAAVPAAPAAPAAPSPLDAPVAGPNPISQRIVLAASKVIYEPKHTGFIVTYLKSHSDKAQAVGHLALTILREMFAMHSSGPVPPGPERRRAVIGIIRMISELGAAAGIFEDSVDFEKQAFVDAMTEAARTGSTLPRQPPAGAAAPMAAPAAAPGAAPAVPQPGMGGQ